MNVKKEKMKIKVKDYSKIPNKMHFEIQKSTRASIYKDKTKYSRKLKHKKNHEVE